VDNGNGEVVQIVQTLEDSSCGRLQRGAREGPELGQEGSDGATCCVLEMKEKMGLGVLVAEVADDVLVVQTLEDMQLLVQLVLAPLRALLQQGLLHRKDPERLCIQSLIDRSEAPTADAIPSLPAP